MLWGQFGRAIVGVVIGLLVGLVLTAFVFLTRFAPLVNTPRSAHGWILVGLFAVPAVAGLLVGFLWRRR